jgi:CBS domain containing-hemolysin-like protein
MSLTKLEEDPSSSTEVTTNDKPNIITAFLESVRGGFRPRSKSMSLEKAVQEIIEEHNEATGKTSDISENSKSIIQNVLEFSELYVEDIMIPRADIFAININTSLEQLSEKLAKKTYTRIPVFKNNLDDISGFVHIKDIAKIILKKKDFKMEEIIRQCLFVPPSMKISKLLIKMQLSHVHIAIVIDEYGGTTGLVTMEDLMEEIVGQIDDEHDEVDKSFSYKKISDDLYEVSARFSIEDLETKTGLQLHNDKKEIEEDEEEEDYDTLGGLIFSLTGRIPVVGEVVVYSDEIEFEITDANSRAIKRVIVRKKS